MQTYGFLADFSAGALKELEAEQIADRAEKSPAKDLRHLLWASIDNDDSLDLDQLTVAEILTDTQVKVLVAVADVAALVKINSAIDAHARHNTTSVYTAGRVFPMLPEKLSTDLTSLNYHEDRPAMVIGRRGRAGCRRGPPPPPRGGISGPGGGAPSGPGIVTSSWLPPASPPLFFSGPPPPCASFAPPPAAAASSSSSPPTCCPSSAAACFGAPRVLPCSAGRLPPPPSPPSVSLCYPAPPARRFRRRPPRRGPPPPLPPRQRTQRLPTGGFRI
ncbi:MAG: RNB domain-containing ribonuclease [Deltaproteobacteria bacterium]|nr:RNB domain-containing ribonuclease [Deltaproteobacteria bacterium]